MAVNSQVHFDKTFGQPAVDWNDQPLRAFTVVKDNPAPPINPLASFQKNNGPSSPMTPTQSAIVPFPVIKPVSSNHGETFPSMNFPTNLPSMALPSQTPQHQVAAPAKPSAAQPFPKLPPVSSTVISTTPSSISAFPSLLPSTSTSTFPTLPPTSTFPTLPPTSTAPMQNTPSIPFAFNQFNQPQPTMIAQPQFQFNQPQPTAMAQPQFSQPQFQFNQPQSTAMAQPQFNQPQFNQPQFNQPQFNQPQFQFNQPQPTAVAQPTTTGPFFELGAPLTTAAMVPVNEPVGNTGKITIPVLPTSLPFVAHQKPVIQQFNMNSDVVTENDIQQRRLEIMRGIDQTKLISAHNGSNNKGFSQSYLKNLASELGIHITGSGNKAQLKAEIEALLAENNMLRSQRG